MPQSDSIARFMLRKGWNCKAASSPYIYTSVLLERASVAYTPLPSLCQSHTVATWMTRIKSRIELEKRCRGTTVHQRASVHIDYSCSRILYTQGTAGNVEALERGNRIIMGRCGGIWRAQCCFVVDVCPGLSRSIWTPRMVQKSFPEITLSTHCHTFREELKRDFRYKRAGEAPGGASTDAYSRRVHTHVNMYVYGLIIILHKAGRRSMRLYISSSPIGTKTCT